MEWYDPNRREMPWKSTTDPYHIWLSEIILQQTRVEQGTPYYLKFIELYPNVADLARASEESVMKAWEGLGYYSRARNLHAAARQVVEHHGGEFPKTHEQILQLKGVGPYTAAAIASFAYNLPHAVLDGNVFRVLSRYFGIEVPTDTTEGKKLFTQLAQDCLDKKSPAMYNQAIMDFGALVCTPSSPLCTACPLASNCKAFQQGAQAQLPVKSKKIIRHDRFFTFLVITDGKSVLLEKRKENDIWKALHQFPGTEMQELDPTITPEDLGWRMHWQHLNMSPVYRQVLTHRNIHAQFVEVHVNSLDEVCHPDKGAVFKVPLADISQLAFPKIIRDYLSDRFNSLH